jgi:alkylation response protein AidB-like acyl-CoA dehydrogenase
MDFNLTEEQKLLRNSLREFLEGECPRELVREYDEKGEYPHELLKKLANLGYMGICVPEKYSGVGGNAIDSFIVYEEISRAMSLLAWAMGNITLYGNEFILYNGNEAQRQYYLPKLVKAETKFAFALTEPDAGSDAASIKTNAVFRDGDYIINGNKMYITGAGVSDIVITAARTAESKYGGITLFMVDSKSEGYSATPLKKLGYHGSNTCEVVYSDVKVSPENILGGPEGLNQGWDQMMKLLNGERLALSACALGIGQAALDDALQYAKKRVQFDQAIGKFQVIQHRLVEMATEMEAARQLAYYAAWKESMHLECIKETSMAKYFATETAKKVALQGMQILGGYGYMMEVDMQRYLRDVVVLTIGGGTTEIQKNIIAKTLGL